MKNTQSNYIGGGIVIGAAIGAVLGRFVKNLALGISLGASIGAAIGSYFQERRESGVARGDTDK